MPRSAERISPAFLARALVAVALLAGFYVVGAVLVLGLGAGAFAIVVGGAGPTWLLAVTAAFLLLLVGLVVRAFAGTRTPEPEQPGVLVERDDDPGLWRSIEEIAAFAGTRPPDEIRLVAVANAAVAEDARWLGLRPGTRRLYLGAPLLVTLEREHLRSVLAHEFGHYCGRHTALGPVTYRGHRALERVVERLGEGSLPAMVFEAYGRIVLAVSSSVGRRQELEADRLSAELVGPSTAAAALREVRPVAAAWDAFVEGYLPATDDVRPTEVFEGFGFFWADPARQEVAGELRARPEQAPPTVYDSHPSIAQRVAYVLRIRDDRVAAAPMDEGRLGLDLMSRPDELLAELELSLFDHERPAAPLTDLLATSREREAALYSRYLRRQLHDVGLTPDLEGALRMLDAGRHREVLGALADQSRIVDHLALAARVVGDTVATAMVERRDATFDFSWAHGGALRGRDGVALDPWSVVGEAGSPRRAAAALADWLETHGVAWRADPAAPAAVPGPEPVDTRPGEVMAILAPLAHRSRRSLYVLQGGVVLERLGRRRAVGAWLRSIGSRYGDMVARRAVRRTPDQLLEDRSASYVAWGDIEWAELTARRGGRAQLAINVHGGGRLVVRTTRHTQVLGEPWRAIAAGLGPSFVGAGLDR